MSVIKQWNGTAWVPVGADNVDSGTYEQKVPRLGATTGQVPTLQGDGTLAFATVVGGGSGVASVNTRTGAVTLTSTDVGLGNVTNTSDANKPVSTAQATAIAARLQDSANLSDLTNAATARTNLGLGTAATQASSAFDAAGAAAAATATAAQKSNNLSDLLSVVTARTNLGLGSAATQAASAFDTAGAASAAQSAAQAASLAVANNLSDVANVTTARNNLLPSQSTHGGQFLHTDGTTAAWASLTPATLAPTAVKVAGYTAVVGDLVPVDTTTGSVTITLPSAPSDGSQIAVKHIIAGGQGDIVTIAAAGSDVFNVASGQTTFLLTAAGMGITLQYKATGAIWYVMNNDPAYPELASPAEHGGLLAWSMHPWLARGTTILVSGRIVFQRVRWTKTRTISSVSMYVSSAGATLTSGQSKIAIYTGAGALLAGSTSADQSTSWNSNGTKTVAISVSVPADPTSWIYVGIMCNGTTPATIQGVSGAFPIMDFGYSGSEFRFEGIDSATGLTAMPATINPAFNSASDNSPILVALG